MSERRSLVVRGLKRLRQLEEKNRKLKKLVAGLTLNEFMLQDVLRKTLRLA